MEMKICPSRNRVVISLSGAFDAAAVAELRPRLERAVETVPADFFVDMSDVDVIDSSGIGAIVFMLKRLAISGRSLKLVGTRGQPKQLIEFLRVNRAIELIDRVPEAMEFEPMPSMAM
jgi:anti-anti-sigma factor